MYLVKLFFCWITICQCLHLKLRRFHAVNSPNIVSVVQGPTPEKTLMISSLKTNSFQFNQFVTLILYELKILIHLFIPSNTCHSFY